MILFLFFLFISITGSEKKYIDLNPKIEKYLDPLKNLTDTIFNGYHKHVAPLVSVPYTSETSDSTSCVLFLNTLNIINLDELNELMTVTIDLYQYWYDPRLRWDRKLHSDIQEFYVQQQHVWNPPFRIYSANEMKDQREEGLRTVRLIFNGMLDARHAAQITTVCKLKMDDFPFDIQVCNITMGISSIKSRLYDFGLELIPKVVKDSCSFGNSAWDLIDIRIKHCHSPQRMIEVEEKTAKIVLTLKRNPVYYMYMIVLPTSVINTFSILGVFMKGNGKFEKLEMGLAHIMTMMVVLIMIAEKLPKTSQVPLLGKYIIFNLCSMIVALMISTNQKNMRNLLSRKYFRINKNYTKRMLTCCVIIMQIANFSSSIYILYRYLVFEHRHEPPVCKRAEEYNYDRVFEHNE